MSNEAPFTPVENELDERDQQAVEAVETLREAREHDEAEPSETQDASPEPLGFGEEDARMMLSYGLGVVEMTVGSVFDVPFEIDTRAGNQWLDAASPMLQKYGPAGLKWFGQYQGEFVFSMASMTLIGGCAKQVRQLKQAQETTEPETPQEVDSEAPQSSEQE
ncbi:hypothetical protein BCT47_26245 [Vibrio splendidus]|uniref:hypothetical protein n=1 Tax=Vibrio splendidus TaxID=29497 RepID=UPI000C8546E7|nr:hypothetical protein [Vibrio splendidus]PMM67497.1 hypothetical protein BCT47_26245 [Vibrio splendidus]